MLFRFGKDNQFSLDMRPNFFPSDLYIVSFQWCGWIFESPSAILSTLQFLLPKSKTVGYGMIRRVIVDFYAYFTV